MCANNRTKPALLARIRAWRTRGGPAAFVKKHGRFMAAVGVLIMFATFVVRDGLSEMWKNQADVISTAQVLFATQENRQALARIQDLLEKGGPTRARAGSFDAASADALMDAGRYMQQIVTYNFEASNVKMLIHRLPDNKTDMGAYKNIMSRYTGYKKFVINTGKEIRQFMDQGTLINDDPDMARHMDERLTYLDGRMSARYERAGYFIERSWNRLADKVARQSEILRRKAERDSRDAWLFAAAFYAIGSALTLVGQMYGQPPPMS